MKSYENARDRNVAEFRALLEALNGGGVVTTIGDIDVLGEVVGGGTYEQLLPHTQLVSILGRELRCATLPKLIELERAAGRPKDLERLAELEAILEELEREE